MRGWNIAVGATCVGDACGWNRDNGVGNTNINTNEDDDGEEDGYWAIVEPQATQATLDAGEMTAGKAVAVVWSGDTDLFRGAKNDGSECDGGSGNKNSKNLEDMAVTADGRESDSRAVAGAHGIDVAPGKREKGEEIACCLRNIAE